MKFVWPESARSELRAIDREGALRILHALTDYAQSGEGDIRALAGEWEGCFRLRVGEYRVIFSVLPGELAILRVRHRSNAYR
ncbi:MAG TPA: type II toxin-antitoxin system RelE/ParE family toxin [Bryobacteraceae bacterium]|nr:type II toxin-antitoxin system RelE/ParE family toxin [Bryobacteraceae bacterium]